MKKIVILVSILTCFFWACQDKIENPALVINPENYILQVDTSELVKYNIYASAAEDHSLKTLRIKYSINNEMPKPLLDSTLNGLTKLSYDFYFRVPVFFDTTLIKFEFYVSDEAGNSMQMERILIIPIHTESGTPLTEFAGNTLYCDPIEKSTAFNLLKCEPLSKNSADSANMHVLADTILKENISKRWLSPAKLKFVSFNGLDYAKATQQTARDAYDAGVKTDFISNINVNDIYVTRIIENTIPRYIVIRVMNIYDDAGTQNDRFIFNVKK